MAKAGGLYHEVTDAQYYAEAGVDYLKYGYTLCHSCVLLFIVKWRVISRNMYCCDLML